MKVKKNLEMLMTLVSLLVIIISLSASFKISAQHEKNQILNYKTIFIDAGHGGKDNGASVENVIEDSINLSISGFLLEELVTDGAYVLMSRTSDYDLSSMYMLNRKREDLKKRVKYINQSKPDLFISIHLNTYPSSSVKGGQVFYQNNDQSKKLANAIQNEINVFNNNNKKTKQGDYFILNKTIPAGVLIECGFLSNQEERKNLNDSDYQRKIAKAIKKGIVNYFVSIKV